LKASKEPNAAAMAAARSPRASQQYVTERNTYKHLAILRIACKVDIGIILVFDPDNVRSVHTTDESIDGSAATPRPDGGYGIAFLEEGIGIGSGQFDRPTCHLNVPQCVWSEGKRGGTHVWHSETTRRTT
jgi:hypothetical protein